MAEAPESGWRSPAPAPAPAPAQSDYEPIHPGSGRGDWRERLKRFGWPDRGRPDPARDEAEGDPAAAAEAEDPDHLGDDAGLDRRLRADLGLDVRDRLRRCCCSCTRSGHVIQLRREGIEASAPMFIPFLGAVVAAKSMGDDAAAEARVGLAGPDPRHARHPGPARRSGSRPARSSGRRSPTSASSSTSSTCCRCCPSTAAGRWPRSRPGSGSSAIAGLIALTFAFLEPDPAPDPAVRRVRALAPLEGPQHARGPRLPRDPARTRVAGRRRLPRARGRARDRRRPDLPAQERSATSRPAISRQSRVGAPGPVRARVEPLGDDAVEALLRGPPRAAPCRRRGDRPGSASLGPSSSSASSRSRRSAYGSSSRLSRPGVQEVEGDQGRRRVASRGAGSRSRSAPPRRRSSAARLTPRRPRRAPRPPHRARPARRRARARSRTAPGTAAAGRRRRRRGAQMAGVAERDRSLARPVDLEPPAVVVARHRVPGEASIGASRLGQRLARLRRVHAVDHPVLAAGAKERVAAADPLAVEADDRPCPSSHFSAS